VFRYTSWHFYAISGTNLLTRCHSASSLFSAIFVFQKSYIGNILGIGRNKFLKSYFSRKLPEIRRGEGEGPQVMSTHASVLVDSVGPPSAEVCRTAASFP
jgi:hypothetical protein